MSRAGRLGLGTACLLAGCHHVIEYRGIHEISAPGRPEVIRVEAWSDATAFPEEGATTNLLWILLLSPLEVPFDLFASLHVGTNREERFELGPVGGLLAVLVPGRTCFTVKPTRAARLMLDGRSTVTPDRLDELLEEASAGGPFPQAIAASDFPGELVERVEIRDHHSVPEYTINPWKQGR